MALPGGEPPSHACSPASRKIFAAKAPERVIRRRMINAAGSGFRRLSLRCARVTTEGYEAAMAVETKHHRGDKLVTRRQQQKSNKSATRGLGAGARIRSAQRGEAPVSRGFPHNPANTRKYRQIPANTGADPAPFSPRLPHTAANCGDKSTALHEYAWSMRNPIACRTVPGTLAALRSTGRGQSSRGKVGPIDGGSVRRLRRDNAGRLIRFRHKFADFCVLSLRG